MGVSWWWLGELNIALLAIALIAALRWGASPERVSVSVLVAMPVADAVYHLIVDRGAFYQSVDIGHLVIDSVAALSLLALAANANRIYPLWMAAFQVISVLAHFAREASVAVAGLAYAYLAYGPFYFELVALLTGIALHARRQRRRGTYRSWRTSSNHSREPAPKRSLAGSSHASVR